jgi:type IV secretion system protein VirD4
MEIPNWLRWTLGVAVFIAATVAAIWLSGFFFFAFSKENPIGKTDFSTWWTYWQFYQFDPTVAKRLKAALIASIAVAYGLPLFVLVALLREVRSLHGEARFAKVGEIAKAGLFADNGIIVGKWKKNRYLMFPGMQFVLLAAPTRSGKGVGIVIPNLLNWPESVVVLDVKLENFLITSKFRARWGQEIYLFNPFSISDVGGDPLQGRTHRYNPLGYISKDPRLRVTDILTIGYSLYPGDGRDAFFDDAARNLFLGLVLYLCETPALPCTIGEVLRQSSGKGRPMREHIQAIIHDRNYREYGDVTLNEMRNLRGSSRAAVVDAIMQIRHCDKAAAEALCSRLPVILARNVEKTELARIEALLKKAEAQYKIERRYEPLTEWNGEGLPLLSMECVDALNRFIAISDNTLTSVVATFNVPLTIWASPIVDAATSANDFDLRDVRKRRMSIYLGIPANKLVEAKLLLNMFYTQLVNLNTDRLLHASPELKYTCLMLNDEFTAPGRIGVIDKANPYMAGFGLRLLTIIQSPGQLEAEPPKGYGRESARAFVTNHACQILFTPRQQQDANEYSEMLGFYTFKARGTSRQFGGSGGRSESESDQKRALMLPQELKEMRQERQIINLENTKPIRCGKIAYFADPVFMNRLKSVSPTLAGLGRRLPSKGEFESVWGQGELAVDVPALDIDLHEAMVKGLKRNLTLADVENGIDLRRLAIDTSKIAVISEESDVKPEDLENFVNSFFDALDAAAADDDDEDALDAEGSGEPPTADELADLEAAAAADTGLEIAAPLAFADEMPDGAVSASMEEAQPKADFQPVLDLSVLDKPLIQN